MSTYSKAALAVLALALSCSPLLAQGDPQDSPPGQQGGPQRGGPGGGFRGFGSNGGPNGGPDRGPGGNSFYRRDDGDRFGRGDKRGFDRGGDHRGMHGFRDGQAELGLQFLNNPDIRKQVGITDEQAAKLRQQVSDFRKSEIRDRADLQIKRLDLQDLLDADKPDRAAIDSKLSEISASQLALEKSSVEFRLNMRDAITPAQREKIRQLMMNGRRGGPAPPQQSPQGRRGNQGPGGPGGAGRGPRGGAPTPGSQAPPPPPPSGN
jgi:Spy/CpxP family protein refolding chaperone